MARPRKNLPPNGLAIIRQAASNGVKECDIAKALGMNLATWRRIREEDPQAREAYAEAKSIEESKLVGVLFRKAVEKDDTVAAIFLLKSRHSYRDQGPTDANDGARVAVQINIPAPLKPEDYAKLITVGPNALPTPDREAA